MKTLTFDLGNRIAKELHWKTNDLADIKRAEKQKTRLENDGFILTLEKIMGFESAMFVYVKFNKSN